MNSGIVDTPDFGQIISISSRQGDGIPIDITAQITADRSSIFIGNDDSADIIMEDLTLAPKQCSLRRDGDGELFFVNRCGSEIEKKELAEKLAKKSKIIWCIN